MKQTLLAATLVACMSATGSSVAAPEPNHPPLDPPTLDVIRSQFGRLMELANRHDLATLHGMFWQSPSVLLVAKSAVPSDGNWAGFWGNDAVDQKLHDIAASGPVELVPDMAKFRVVGLTQDVAESYAPLTITVSYAGQDGTPKPFLMIVNWIRVDTSWKVASEIILPVPPTSVVSREAGRLTAPHPGAKLGIRLQPSPPAPGRAAGPVAPPSAPASPARPRRHSRSRWRRGSRRRTGRDGGRRARNGARRVEAEHAAPGHQRLRRAAPELTRRRHARRAHRVDPLAPGPAGCAPRGTGWCAAPSCT